MGTIKDQLAKLGNYTFLGVKFGITGALIGLLLNIIWGNLEEVIYTIITGFIIGVHYKMNT